jgi:hypothetical protein
MFQMKDGDVEQDDRKDIETQNNSGSNILKSDAAEVVEYSQAAMEDLLDYVNGKFADELNSIFIASSEEEEGHRCHIPSHLLGFIQIGYHSFC